jgi:hypothetical protein
LGFAVDLAGAMAVANPRGHAVFESPRTGSSTRSRPDRSCSSDWWRPPQSGSQRPPSVQHSPCPRALDAKAPAMASRTAIDLSRSGWG